MLEFEEVKMKCEIISHYYARFKEPALKISHFGQPSPAFCQNHRKKCGSWVNTDGRFLYAYKEAESLVKVLRIEIATGRIEPMTDIALPEPVSDTLDSMLLTPDGKSYICNYLRTVSDLYLVEGLR